MLQKEPKNQRKSIRLKRYDYTQNGAYFITICTYHRQCWFGQVLSGQMKYNTFGKIVCELWTSLPNRFSHLKLDAFMLMPNHLHGILIIDNISNNYEEHLYQEQFGKPRAGSISTVVRSFKSAVTKRINIMRSTRYPPIWQRNYYESIIRDEAGLDAVRTYINNNPLQWHQDENYRNNLAFPEELLNLDF